MFLCSFKLDALIPACQEFRKAISKGTDGVAALEASLSAAKQGCADTAKMFAKWVFVFIIFNVMIYIAIYFNSYFSSCSGLVVPVT